MMIPKFRAWEKNMNAMIPVENIDFLAKQINTNSAWRMFNEIELMQSTGLKDRKGVEIYEGDIVRWKDLESFDDFKIDEVLKVEYSNEFLKWVAIYKNGLQDDLYDFSDNRELEVIGNIYENPELLEKKLY